MTVQFRLRLSRPRIENINRMIIGSGNDLVLVELKAGDDVIRMTGEFDSFRLSFGPVPTNDESTSIERFERMNVMTGGER